MKTDLNQQRTAIAIALKDKMRELIKAKESKNLEWITDCENEIQGLSDAIETFKLIEQFSLLLARIK